MQSAAVNSIPTQKEFLKLQKSPENAANNDLKSIKKWNIMEMDCLKICLN